jgi:hypothetical protein
MEGLIRVMRIMGFPVFRLGRSEILCGCPPMHAISCITGCNSPAFSSVQVF